MKKTMGYIIGQFLRRAILAMVCGVFVASAAYGQECVVNQIKVTIGTAAQNPLPGGVNNLDVEIHYIDGTIQKVPDVNRNNPWKINSQNVVTIPLNQSVPVTEIKRIRLIYNISAGEWDMSFLRAHAIGGAWKVLIAAWGPYPPTPTYPPHQFTATYPAFGRDTVIPGNTCSASLSRLRTIGPARVVPGAPVESREIITNNIVIQMVRRGLPESAIIAKMRANPTKFDLTLDKILALHRQGVSTHILNAMIIDELRQRKGIGGTRAANAGELIPGAQQTMLDTQAKPLLADGGKSVQPTAVERPAVTNGTIGDGSVRPAASAMPAAQAGTLNSTGGTATANRTAATAPAMMQKTSPGTIGAAQTMSAQGNVSSSTALTQSARTVAVAPQAVPAASGPRSASAPRLRSVNLVAAMGRVPSQINLQVAAECAKDPTPRILSVTSGASTTDIFKQGGQYTIWGCSLGDKNPNNLAVVSSGGGGCISVEICGVVMVVMVLDVTSWSPNSIVASADTPPGVVWPNGQEPDLVTNATLILCPNGVTKGGVALPGFEIQISEN
jgi:hypothetical protein